MHLFPPKEQILLKGSFGHSDPFSIQRSVVIIRDLRIIRRDKNVIRLRSHGKGRVEHILPTLLRVGDIAHHINLPVLQLLQKFRPGTLYILIVPARVCRHLPLVFVGIS